MEGYINESGEFVRSKDAPKGESKPSSLEEKAIFHKENYSEEERESRLRNLLAKLESLQAQREKLDQEISSVNEDIDVMRKSFQE